jgi:hypothetical protein
MFSFIFVDYAGLSIFIQCNSTSLYTGGTIY